MRETMVEALGWALIHSLWQCTALAIFFAAANLALRRASANLRYILAYSTLLAMPVSMVATFFALLGDGNSTAAAPQSTGVLTRIATVDLPAAISVTPSHSLPYLNMIVWFWIAGVVATSTWSAAGWLVAQRLKRRSKQALPEVWQSRLATLAGQLGIRRGIRLCESTLAQVPAVIGWIRPVILVPAGALISLTAQELEAVLAHELAHIRRFDYVANLLQSAIEALMFYHPAMWWVGKRIRAERENCCDDLAIAACGDRVVYARALTALEEMRGAYPSFAMAATGGPLVARVRRLLGKDDPRRRSLPIWMALATVLIAAMAVSSGIRLRAQNPEVPPQPPVAPVAIERVAMPASAQPAPPAQPRAAEPSRPSFQPPVAPLAPPADAPQMPESPALAPAPAHDTTAKWLDQQMETTKRLMAAQTAPAQKANEVVRNDAPAGHHDGYLGGLVDAGYTQISVDDIIALRDNGVEPKYIRGIMQAGLATPSPKDLINLHNNGVSPEFVRRAVGAGIGNLNVERIVHLAQNGVNLENIQRIHALGYGPFSIDQIVELHNNGVSAGLFEALKDSGFTKVDAHQAVEAQQNGLSAKSLRHLREQGFKGLTFEQVIKLCRAGVI
jgi:beta-lactamase regulating signal transducer with metallopeptidase domain